VTPVAAPVTPVIEPQWRQPEPVAVHQPAPQPAMHQPHHQPAPQPMMRSDVTVRPAAPKMNYEAAPVPQPVAHQPEPAPYMQAGQFVPPAPEQPMRPAQMPNIADFPPVAQRQFEQAREPIAAPVEKKRTSLLDRLTAAGFGRRAEPEAPAPQPVRMQQPQQPAPQAQPMPQAAPAAQEFAKRAAPAPRPQQRLTEDDQLEIPAFLRRQSN
jgi:cell division protein FtsZ